MTHTINSLLPFPGSIDQLYGRYVYLEPAAEGDREVIRPLARDERIWEFTKTLMVNDTYDDQFDRYYEEALGLGMTGTGQAFVIRERLCSADASGMRAGETAGGAAGTGGQIAATMREPETSGGAAGPGGGRIIGMTRMFAIDWPSRRLEIGHTWYIPEIWGRVHNKECKLLLLQYLFESLHFHRVEFRIAHQNLRSQRAVEKIGGQREGELRKFVRRNDGVWRNTVIFSVLDEEWPEKKPHLLQLVESLAPKG